MFFLQHYLTYDFFLSIPALDLLHLHPAQLHEGRGIGSGQQQLSEGQAAAETQGGCGALQRDQARVPGCGWRRRRRALSAAVHGPQTLHGRAGSSRRRPPGR